MDKLRQIGYAKILIEKAQCAMSAEGMFPESDKQAEAHKAINEAYNKIISCFYEVLNTEVSNEKE